jgi:hypothetical protein
MFLVAVVSLARAVEDEAPLLAADLGVTAYEIGLVLRSPSPSIVLRTPDRERATEILKRLRTRGHDAIACDTSAIVASKDMFAGRSFRFDDDAFVVTGDTNASERTAYTDLLALVRATHAHDSTTVEKTEKLKLSIGRAAMTGGLVPAKRVTSERTVRTSEREQVLYVFRRVGPPFLLRASRLRYDGLANAIRPTQLENFTVLIDALRQRAGNTTAYDDRFVAQAKTPEDADVAAHLIGLALTRERPWRG